MNVNNVRKIAEKWAVKSWLSKCSFASLKFSLLDETRTGQSLLLMIDIPSSYWNLLWKTQWDVRLEPYLIWMVAIFSLCIKWQFSKLYFIRQYVNIVHRDDVAVHHITSAIIVLTKTKNSLVSGNAGDNKNLHPHIIFFNQFNWVFFNKAYS